MSIDSKTVKRVARLARIRIEEAEVGHLASEIGGIISWVEQLSEVKTEGVEPLAALHDRKLPWREDAVTDGGKPEDVLANAPQAVEGFFAVPKVVE